MSGVVVSINVSPEGGVPKLPVRSACRHDLVRATAEGKRAATACLGIRWLEPV